MRFMVIVPATKESEAGVLPDEKGLADMAKYGEEMVKAGVVLGGDGLRPSSEGARVRFEDGKTIVTDGPFTESKELIAGYSILQVASLEEAVEWVRRAPFGGGVTLEIRRIFDPADFAASDPTGEIGKMKAAQREEIARQMKKG